MSTPSQSSALILAFLVSGSLLLSGCGGDDPIAPPAPVVEEEKEEVILTPTKLVITKIYCPRWPKEKSNGDAWDTFGGNPDIYFQIGNCQTNRHDNHRWEIVMHSNFPSSGCRMNYGDTFTVNMWDADSPSADDLMSSATFRPRDLYKRDNATTISFALFGSNGSEMYCTAKWIY